ncbi:hypothetical protein COU23_02295 [Candidatus Kuenenbacteria bacterium CG10_big_fil_rev_8_21_14_0_10_36_11]|uniref:Lipoprotein signal peptidase n=1 Tax=Candidatus Kuenenbacteria bacterium CG10_big_fil_rev_8_21_14_0_10_36_11 TaxID=1974618 RepID=A0A2M6WA99_9BACT|nr:MAG: hypothetical protein COU23_02295 [Candidatus Kuenenbacteria bacterium CG10_big_fil_rev_8_21_14_0_10_36_11]
MGIRIYTDKRVVWLSLAGLAFFILDRVLKNLSVAGKIFFYKNSGIAFSLKISGELFLYFYLIVIIVLFLIFWQLLASLKNKHLLLATGYLLLAAGIISNLIDRFRFGFIVDYLNFYFFYNNLADVMIMAGVIILILQLICRSDKCLK